MRKVVIQKYKVKYKIKCYNKLVNLNYDLNNWLNSYDYILFCSQIIIVVVVNQDNHNHIRSFVVIINNS